MESQDKLPRWLKILEIETLREPTGLAFLGDDLLIADHYSNDILKVDNDGRLRMKLSQEEPEYKLRRPHGIGVETEYIIIADSYNDRICRFNWKFRHLEDVKEIGGVGLKRPHAVARNFDVPGEYFIVDTENNRVVKYSTAGHVEATFPSDGAPQGLLMPCGLGLSQKHVFVADTFNHRIAVLDKKGSVVRMCGSHGRARGQFQYPVAVALRNDWIVISDEYNQRLQLWRADNEGEYFTATCVSSTLCSPWLGKPFGLVFDPNGDLFIADRLKGKILRVNFEQMLLQYNSPRNRI